MRHLARQFLNIAMLVVAFSVAGINGYASAIAACHTHVHHHGDGQHVHLDEVGASAAVSAEGSHHVAHDQTVAEDVGHGAEFPGSTDQPCKHIHVHCCATFATVAGDANLSIVARPQARVAIADTQLPAGQLASPLFRPPRHAA